MPCFALLLHFKADRTLLFRRLHRWLLVGGGIAMLTLVIVAAQHIGISAEGAPCTVCISQVYGGGGNSDATFNADFIELFNATGETISLTGYSVAYAPSQSSDWAMIALEGHSIPAFGYQLLQLGAGTEGDGAPLPTPDIIGAINIAADKGKVRVQTADAVIDLLGYGNANESEGQPAPAGSNTKGVLRSGGGCVDTNNNSADFGKAPPNPRNSASSQNFCTPPTPTETVTDTPTSTSTETATNTPEPTSTETPTPTATNTPEPTSTETPTPTATNTPESLPTNTPTPTPTETAANTLEPSPTTAPTATSVATATPTLTATATPVPTETSIETPTPVPTALPQLRLSEIMPDPSAVPDNLGEFIEVTNLEPQPVNLRGWQLIDGGGRSHTITADLWLDPGAYGVLTRGDAGALAGYAHSDYQFTTLQLGNTSGGVALYAPGSATGAPPVDAVLWGSGATLSVQPGASFERTDLFSRAWVIATTPWNATHADKGSPGAASAPAGTPSPTVTPTSIATPTATPPTEALPPTATPAEPPTATPTAGPPPRLRLSEIMVDPLAVADNVGEFIEVANIDTQPVNLRDWVLIDGGGRTHIVAADLWLDPGVVRVLTRGNAAALAGYAPSDYQYASLQLGNSGGGVALYAPGMLPAAPPVDALLWGDGTSLTVQSGASFERIDPAGADWRVATTSWSTQHADKGSPGAAFTVIAPTPSPAATLPPAPTATPILLPTPTPTAGPAPLLRLSEVMADPLAIADNAGEFVELTNLAAHAVNLRDWVLIDGGGRSHIIAADLWLDPGAYRILTRGDANTLAGYTYSDYQFAALQLGNSGGGIALYAPGSGAGAPPVDALTWGDGAPLTVQPGASFERVDLLSDAWTIATTPWSAAHADKGSPGAAFVGVISPAPTLAPSPFPSLTPTPTLAPLPAQWLPAGEASTLQIDEVHFVGSDDEFIALVNLSDAPVALAGWMIGDAETPGDGEGMFTLPAAGELAGGAVFVIARNAAAFRHAYGRAPDAEWTASDGSVPDLLRAPRFGSGDLALNDSGDEVVLIDPAGRLADAVAYKTGEYAALTLSGALGPASGHSLQRVPAADFVTVRDVRHRFLTAPPRPFDLCSLPVPATRAPVTLAPGFLAVWGSLGGASNFTPGFAAPPHYLLAEAAAQGLDFLALADRTPTQPVRVPAGVTALTAWRWQADEDAVIVYDGAPPVDQSHAGMVTYLAGVNAPWQNTGAPGSFSAAPLLVAADSAPPASLDAWFAAWRTNTVPAVPAGNSNPDLPGTPELQPRYTGLAVVSSDVTGIHEALHARRGWVTTAPGLWLTLQAELGDGQRTWMGEWLAPDNAVTLHIHYGDRAGAPAGLALWQDGRPLRQLDLPPADGHWTVTLPAVPGAILTAVATQFDGDFAVTAPLFVAPDASGAPDVLLLNEVLPAPRNDYNGDGLVDGEDEYIELYNPGQLPMPLTGWTLLDGDDDAIAHHMTFGVGRFLGGGERLLLLHKANRLSLRNDGGVVRLLDPGGGERDRVTWDADLTRGRSVARLPDGGAWVWSADATPGAANTNTGVNNFAPWPETPPPAPSNNPPPPNPAVLATAGQRGGPPGSIAQAKLAGLGAWVEFRAVVVAPPGLFNSSIYVADVTGDGVTAGIGVNVYLRRGDYPPLQAGDLVLLRGRLDSFRGETELIVDTPDQIWRITGGTMLTPLTVRAGEVGEALEGRLVTLQGVVTGWQGDSIFLGDPEDSDAAPVRITVRTTLSWKRPYVRLGEVWQATGVVSQFARETPWNGGYRILVRWQDDLLKMTP